MDQMVPTGKPRGSALCLCHILCEWDSHFSTIEGCPVGEADGWPNAVVVIGYRNIGFSESLTARFDGDTGFFIREFEPVVLVRSWLPGDQIVFIDGNVERFFSSPAGVVGSSS